MIKTTKKAVVQEAKWCEATNIANNIYKFENLIFKLEQEGNQVKKICYSCGTYGINSMLALVKKNNESYYIYFN